MIIETGSKANDIQSAGEFTFSEKDEVLCAARMVKKFFKMHPELCPHDYEKNFIIIDTF